LKGKGKEGCLTVSSGTLPAFLQVRKPGGGRLVLFSRAGRGPPNFTGRGKAEKLGEKGFLSPGQIGTAGQGGPRGWGGRGKRGFISPGGGLGLFGVPPGPASTKPQTRIFVGAGPGYAGPPRSKRAFWFFRGPPVFPASGKFFFQGANRRKGGPGGPAPRHQGPRGRPEKAGTGGGLLGKRWGADARVSTRGGFRALPRISGAAFPAA